MNGETNKLLWRVRFRSLAITLLLGALGLVVVLSVRGIVQTRLPALAEMLILFLPLVVFQFWPRRAVSPELSPVPLHAFLARPDARVAPNQPESVSAKIAKWLAALQDRHGSDSVLVAVQSAEPHVTDTVFVVGDLPASDAAAITAFGANHRRVSLADFKRRFPQVSVQRRVIHELVWD